MSEQPDLPAGRFSTWLLGTLSAQSSEGGVEVPCGGCTACCRSSYFIHIGPDETRTLTRIPRDLLVPAPGWPEGTMVLGYDEHGHCPMLVDDRCSIYDDRPRSCRIYDCRVFAAAGLAPEDDGKPLIAQQVRRWRFGLATATDRDQQAAVRAAAAFLRQRPDSVSENPSATSPSSSNVAIAAIKVHRLFLAADTPDAETVRAALRT